ncbi:hypothetical protein THAOC_03041 [Thalassiosira oceanica]|uniref:Uncharacterized protein n=1 Tax=Thalassiosira oceanica TaxID=159749 RepID=K0TQ12_THAOC|nr:hypothetical protein THAOC_03041 [Thalassiosira oceanica]|eukprot:EJK75242.1 hypothetical protein THAOC_03041 [Thalassiosira oceanica]
MGDNEVRNISFRWKFIAVDGDGAVITIRVDSALSAEAKFLSPGTISTSSTAFPVYVNYGDTEVWNRLEQVFDHWSRCTADPTADDTPTRLIAKPREITATNSQARKTRVSEAIEAEIVLVPRNSGWVSKLDHEIEAEYRTIVSKSAR